DIGGATTDVFSVFDGEFNRTVSANLGMSYSISNVCATATLPGIMRWVHLEMDERELRNRIKNKMIRPTTIPQTLEALLFEQAVAREALRLAFAQHCEFAVAPQGGLQPRGIGDMFRQRGGPRSLVDPLRLDLLVASGGVLSHAPRMAQTAAMLIDSFEPAGFTRLAKDSIFMMPHLGVLSEVHPQAALEVFERDCLITLGYCVAASGQGRVGEPCFDFELTHAGGVQRGELRVGELWRLPLDPGTVAALVVRPRAAFDLGEGPGRPVEREVSGGTVGLILDARGRPLRLPENREECRSMVSRWTSALGLYPEDPALAGQQPAAQKGIPHAS
ncbi:MAG: glutamate mutase L, partial [Planctomycetaceae bacterium]